MTGLTRTPIRDFHASAIDVQVVDVDWYAEDSEPGDERWRSWEVVQCDECSRYVVVSGTAHNEAHCYIEDGTSCEGSITAEGPMMNYFYPIPEMDHDWSRPEDAARQLKDLPLALVYFDSTDEYALALTGGGMDLSWEIAEGYMRLGYLPPLHFADLPNMAGMRLTPTRRKIFAAFNRAITVKRMRLAWDAKRIQTLRHAMKGR